MDWILKVVIIAVAFLLCGYYMLFYLPQKEAKQRNREKAFELTKAIGEKKIRCVSVKTIFNNNPGEPGRAFYIIEEDAENDSTKYCIKMEEGWDNTAHTVEDARKIVNGIIGFMPYHLWIEELNISQVDFFQHREHDRKIRELETEKVNDRDNLILNLIDDLCDRKMHIERFIRTGPSFKDYWYVLVIEDVRENKYLSLFSYSVYDEQYAKMRVEHYVSCFHKYNSGSGSISLDIVEVDQEMRDFLETHPRFTYQGLYGLSNPLSVDSIEPYYKDEYDAF